MDRLRLWGFRSGQPGQTALRFREVLSLSAELGRDQQEAVVDRSRRVRVGEKPPRLMQLGQAGGRVSRGSVSLRRERRQGELDWSFRDSTLYV